MTAPFSFNSEFDEGESTSKHGGDDATRFTAGDDADDHDFEVAADGAPQVNACLGMLGEYLLLEQIGAGGMGQVFRAEHRTMNRLVAVKILSSSIASQRMLTEQFFAEIRAVAKLMHPNIVTAFDAGSVGNTHYLVMELVEGEVLSERLRRTGPLNSSEAVHVLEQAAKALQYAHSLGIVHRDIKPSNMMLTHDGTLKILDFGLARFGKPMEAEQNKKIFMGTPEYMSPEQIENASNVDGRSDLYSLGATLFYLLTGRSMFTGDKMQVAIAQIRQPPPALFLERSDVDLRLDAVFQRLVEKQPQKRYSSAAELLHHLRQLNLTGPAAAEAFPSPASAYYNNPLFSKGSIRLGDHPTSVALSRSTLAKKSQIVAIDLGMLASTAAFYNTPAATIDGRSIDGEADLGPQLIEQGDGRSYHLRNMLWSNYDQFRIGSAAAAMRQQAPQQVLHSIQRWIGARELSIPLCGHKVPPQVALAAILRQLMLNAAQATDNASSAVVTVPSCYDQTHRRAIRDACHIAGIDLVQLLDKPLAGALSWYDVHSRLSRVKPDSRPQRLLFVHLGGTGLEAAVLETHGTTVRQLGCHGSWKHGSLRWQHLLAEYFVGVLQEQTGKSLREDVAAATRLQRSVEMALDRLTQTSKVEVRFEWSGATVQQTITQQGLVKIAPAMVREIQLAIVQALANAKVQATELDQILVAGSMMRMKPVREIVTAALPARLPLSVLEKADFARGAAIHAHHLAALTQGNGESGLHAISQTCYDFAVLVPAANDGTRKPMVLIDKGTELPATTTRTLRPQAAGEDPQQPRFPSLQIIESTTLGDPNWHLLAKTKPELVFPERQGDAPLQLRFEVDESGILRPSLLWPAGNRQVLIPTCDESALSEAKIAHWNQWLESSMLCGTN